MKDLPEALRRIWEIVSSDDYVSGLQRANLPWRIYPLPRWLGNGQLNQLARTELLRQLTPFLHFANRSIRMRELEERELTDPERRISYYVEVEVRLVGRDQVKDLVEEIGRDPRRMELLADLSDDLTSLLKSALDLFATAGKASEDDDPSWADQPSISPHGQNHHFKEWSYLIELVRDSFMAITEVRPSGAQGLLERWNTIRYPTFRRLLLHALTEWTPQQS